MKFFGGIGKSTPRFLVVGLGNPGSQYAHTRHNAGFLAIDHIAEKLGCNIKHLKHLSLIQKTIISQTGVLLMKPQTYMNNSGEAVRDAANFYKIPAENVIVIYDDTSIGVGALRIRKNGSAGGHNGIKSIISHLGTQDFPRIKLGIGNKPDGYDLADYVLGKFTDDDIKRVSANFDNILSAIECIIEGNTDKAMNLFNKNN